MMWFKSNFEDFQNVDVGKYIRVSPGRPEKGIWSEIEGYVARYEKATDNQGVEYNVMIIRFKNGNEWDILLHPSFKDQSYHYDIAVD